MHSPFPVRFKITSLSASHYELAAHGFYVTITEDQPKIAGQGPNQSVSALSPAAASFTFNVSEEEFYKLRLGDYYVLTLMPLTKKAEVANSKEMKPDLKKVSQELHKLLEQSMPNENRLRKRKAQVEEDPWAPTPRVNPFPEGFDPEEE